jgi:hypothetical protein
VIDEREIVQRAVQRLVPPEPALDRLIRRRARKRRNDRIAGGVVGIAVVAAMVWAAATSSPVDLTLPPASSARPTPSVAPEAGVSGLPPVGATPSAPEHAELVLQLEATATEGASSLWVFDDGRLIWWDFPQGAVAQPSTGLAEQRLTPEGVEFLRSRILVSGLFEDDLELLRTDHAPFLSIVVSNGDRLVEVRWAWHGALLHPEEARPATNEQAAALDGLRTLLASPTTWPAGVWEDQKIRPFVPFTYGICLRGVEQPVEPSRILSLLPDRARSLLTDAEQADDLAGHSECFRVTTEDARTLVEILDKAGIERETPRSPMTQIYLRYDLADPDIPGNVLWIAFAPVLPHGDPTWLGPG